LRSSKVAPASFGFFAFLREILPIGWPLGEIFHAKTQRHEEVVLAAMQFFILNHHPGEGRDLTIPA